MHDDRRRNRKTALLMMGVVCLWQLGALIHLITVSHEICPHGKIIDGHHSDHHADAPDRSSNKDSGAPNRHANHDNCRLLSSLTSAGATPNSIQPATPGLPGYTLLVVFLPESQPVRPTALYLTAPCHSPPRFA